MERGAPDAAAARAAKAGAARFEPEFGGKDIDAGGGGGGGAES